MNSKIETITPVKAAKYLKSNTHNRKLRERLIQRFSGEIKAGRWLVTHQGIAFDQDGKLLDGQHRLNAIVAAGIPVEMMVTRGVPTNGKNGAGKLYAMDVIDCGAQRSVADQLKLMHGVVDCRRVQAVCNMINLVITPKYERITVGGALAILSVYGAELDEMIKIACVSKTSRVAAVIAACTLASKVDAQIAREFMQAMATGESLCKTDPAYHARDFIINGNRSHNRADGLQMLQRVSNAIYHVLKGNPISLLKPGSIGIDYILSRQEKELTQVRMALQGKH